MRNRTYFTLINGLKDMRSFNTGLLVPFLHPVGIKEVNPRVEKRYFN
jgi:hypothetical protein